MQAGDTLESIAYALWGDASYWYLIADANGLTGSETLVAGQDLIIPDKIHNVHNNSDTYRVYDPNEAMGNTSPTAPKKPKHHGGGCGVAQIFIAVIAVAVAIVTAGAALAALGVAGISTVGAGITAVATGSLFTTVGGALATVAAGAIGGAVGSIVSQGVAMAMGMQSQFNWGGVAMGAIGGAISAGIGGSGIFSGISESLGGTIAADFAQGAVSGVAGSILTQGVGVATGLQKKFDWAGVAAAGIGGGVMSAIGGQLKGTDLGLGSSNANATGIDVITGAAGLIANAGTRTLINGTDFGDNIMAALPSVIGNTIGNAIVRQISYDGEVDKLASELQTESRMSPQDAEALASKMLSLEYRTREMNPDDREQAFHDLMAKEGFIQSGAGVLQEPNADGTLVDQKYSDGDKEAVQMEVWTKMETIGVFDNGVPVMDANGNPETETVQREIVFADAYVAALQEENANGDGFVGGERQYFHTRAALNEFLGDRNNSSWAEQYGYTPSNYERSSNNDLIVRSDLWAGAVNPGWSLPGSNSRRDDESSTVLGGQKKVYSLMMPFSSPYGNYSANLLNPSFSNLDLVFWHETGHAELDFSSKTQGGEDLANWYALWKMGYVSTGGSGWH